MGALLHVLGLDSGSGRWYLFWSGIGSDLAEFGIIVALAGLLRRHNCEVHGCWRLGRHQVEGTVHRVCRRHHPEGKLSPRHLQEQYHLYLGRHAGRG